MGGITRAMNHEVFCWLVIEARLELEFAATDSLDVFTFFLGSRNEERNLQWESILHPPPLYLWAFWICSHCENHDCSNAISSTKNAASGKKTPWHGVCVVWDCHDFIFLLAPDKKRVPPRRNPGCSGIPNPCHWIWIQYLQYLTCLLLTNVSG